MYLGIAIPDFFSNPGISGLKNANLGIPGLSPWFWTSKKIPLTVLFWSHDEFLNLDLSAGVLFYIVQQSS